LPILNRKWDKINENIYGKYQKTTIQKQTVMILMNKKYNIKQITKITNISAGVIYNYIRNAK